MQLYDFLHTTKTKVYELAKAIGVSQPTVTLWKDGVAIPNMKNMKKLMIYTRGLVMPNDFFTDFIEEKGYSK